MENNQNVTNDPHEKVIIATSSEDAQKKQDPLNIDWRQMSIKDLDKLERKDLLNIARKEKVLLDLKDWQIKKTNKLSIIKRLKEKQKKEESGSNEQKKEVKKESSNDEQNTEDILLLQGAVIDIFASGDAEKLDLYCTKVLQDNDSELIDQEQAEKIKKFMVKFALVHLIIRKNLGGYKILFSKAKTFFKALKEKYKKRSKNEN